MFFFFDFVFELKKNYFLNGLFKGLFIISEILKFVEFFNCFLVGKKMIVLLVVN